MASVFIAHADADKARADAIADALREGGIGTVKIEAAALILVCWSAASVADPAVIEQADNAKARGDYFGVKLDGSDLPFGFGGLQQVDLSGWDGSAKSGELADLASAVRARAESGSSGVMALPSLPRATTEKSKRPLIAVAAAVALLIAVLAAIYAFPKVVPSTQDKIAGQLAYIPCAWLSIDPIENGDDGRLGLTGVAGDPAGAGRTISDFVNARNMPIRTVSIAKVARIDPRECAAIEAPLKLRRGEGSRLKVTGEPFVLNTKVTPNQALVRVRVALAGGDDSVALLGVEPSGKVTWSIPDVETMRSLKNFDVGLVQDNDKTWEFSIYPDHLGWTGLLLVVGDGPLGEKQVPGTVQSADDFARTLANATRNGKWDAEMVWFRIDPEQGR